jgi:hypothetical protein
MAGKHSVLLLNSLKSDWVIGGLLLTAEYILLPLMAGKHSQSQRSLSLSLLLLFQISSN